jgi:hypothetical protein
MPKEICYSRVEPIKGIPYIFLTELEEDVGTLCDKYFERRQSDHDPRTGPSRRFARQRAKIRIRSDRL